MAEKYEGVKFKHHCKKKQAPKHEYLEELKKWCAIYARKNLAPPYPGGSAGNLSIRAKTDSDEFIITAGHTALRPEMPDTDFCRIHTCDIENQIVRFSGTRIPSSETMLHYALYKKRPEISAVFHGHSPEILAAVESLRLAETRREHAYGTIDLLNSVIDILNKQNFLIIKNHGFLSLGTDCRQAGELSLKYLAQA